MIDLTKHYKTRLGTQVELFAIRGGTVYGRVGEYPEAWALQSGQNTKDKNYDLMEVSPWDHIKKGDSVRVRFSFWDEWCYEIFSGVKENRPTTFGHGGAPQFWDICEKISIEDLP